MEESVEQEQSMEHSRDDIALDMLASANSDEFTPELVAISKAQSQVEQMEEKTLDYVSLSLIIRMKHMCNLLTYVIFQI